MKVIINKSTRVIDCIEFLRMEDNGTWLDSDTWAPLLRPETHEIVEMHSMPQFYADSCYVLADNGSPELVPDMFEHVKQNVISMKTNDINSRVSKAITDGFNYEISIGRSEKQSFHFSYDQHDQRNFISTAIAAMLQKSNNAARTDNEILFTGKDVEGADQIFSFSPDLFLDLYYNGALAHQSRCLEAGWEAKQALNNATSIDDIITALTTFDNAIMNMNA